MTARRRADPCGVGEALEVISGRWKGPIIWWLDAEPGPVRFNALRRLIPEITPRVLTSQLRQLMRDGMVHREHYPEIPPRVEYSLTEAGRSLVPLLAAIRRWSDARLPDVAASRRRFDAEE